MAGQLRVVGRMPVQEVEVTWQLEGVQRTEEVTERLLEVRPNPVRSVEEMPELLRVPGILKGYRQENCSVIQALTSLMSATNETFNFWTHFIPALYFMHLLISFSTIMSIFKDSYLFPLTCYMIAACGYPLVSSLAHAFSCLSLTAFHICFLVDYLAISMYTWAVAYLYYSYCFPPQLMNTWFSHIFLPVAAFNAVFATVCASLSRFCQHFTLKKLLRMGSYIGPYLWDSFPLVIWLYTCDSERDSYGQSRIHHLNQFICVFCACFFYGTNIPELLAPGRFDYLGHSHNLLHIFGVLATNEQLKAVLIDSENRRKDLEASNWIPSIEWATLASPAILLSNVFIVLMFSCYISRQKHLSHRYCSQKAHY